MVRSLTSWMWMLAFDATDQALDATGDATGDVAASLLGHFGTVHVLRRDATGLDQIRQASARDEWTAASMTCGTASAAPVAPGSLDCVAVLDDLATRGLSPASLAEELAEFHRLLKPRGWFVAASQNARPRLLGRAAAKRKSIARRHFTRALARAGFREVRCYFGEPALDRPLILIPDNRAAIGAFEASDSMRGSSRWTRRAAARIGVYAPLYPVYFLLARA